MLQTLDLPCPVCGPAAASPLHDADPETLHRFVKSFRTRHVIAPRPGDLVEKVNAWLQREPGLVHVEMRVHRDAHDIVSGMTLDCYASSRDPGYAFRIDRQSLLVGKTGFRSADVGETLNAWDERHPLRRRIDQVVFARNSRPTQCWVLSTGHREDSEPDPFRAPAPLSGCVYPFVAFMLFVGILVSIVIAASATNTLGWVGPTSWPVAMVATFVILRLIGKRNRRKATRPSTSSVTRAP